MENCPQCNTAREPETDFCTSCGHKFSTEAQQAPPPQVEQPQQAPPPQPEPEPVAQGSAIWIPSNTGEIPIYFDDTPKTFGRSDISEYLKSQNQDPLQISRKQFTFFKESDNYYIEDGTTSVQEKASGNHTTLNGKDITNQGKQQLNNDDKITVSTIVDLIFRNEDAGNDGNNSNPQEPPSKEMTREEYEADYLRRVNADSNAGN